jgi:pimeloyl-ACP methyl ester carboxylesterase
MDTQFLSVDGGKIAYDDQGSGPLVVCVPSMGDVRAEYRFLTPQLVAAGYRVVTMDARGHGESSVGWSDYSVVGVAADIVSLIKHMNVGAALVIGESMGAGATVYAAATEPALIKGIVLIGPFVRDTRPLWQARAFGRVITFPLWGRAFWRSYYTSLYPSRKPADFVQYRQALYDNLGEPGRLAALRGMLVASKAESGKRLDEVKAPTLVLMGSRDPDFSKPEQEGHYVADHLHGSLQMIEGAGHYPQTEMPEIAGPAILDFLQQVKGEVLDGR